MPSELETKKSELEETTKQVRGKAIEKGLDVVDGGIEPDWTVIVNELAYDAVSNFTAEAHFGIIEEAVGSGHLEDYDPLAFVAEHYNEDKDNPLAPAIRGAAASAVQHEVLDDLDALGL